MNPAACKFATLMGSASLITLASTLAAQAQPVAQEGMAQASLDAPEQVLITGSLIHGTQAVGVPVVQIGQMEFTQAAALNVSDYLRNIPALTVPQSTNASSSMGDRERGTYVTIHNLGGTRALLMINGMRYPMQKAQANGIDPSVVPTIAVDHIDVLADGASATYGSDAVSGVINIIMKRGFDGAISEARFGTTASKTGGGGNAYEFSQLYGRPWETGDITVSYHFQKIEAVDSTEYRLKNQWTHDYTPWGLDNVSPLGSSSPGVVSTGAPSSTAGTGCTNCFSVPKGQDASRISWATLQANKGVFNTFNTFALSDLSAPEETHQFTLTFDQRILPGVEFFADGFYSKRLATNLMAAGQTPANTQYNVWAVPSFNPYYPIGAPNGLRVGYTFMPEVIPRNAAGEISKRFDTGFNLELPGGWNGRVFGSFNANVPLLHVRGAVNANAVSAALGWTVAVPPNGSFVGSGLPAAPGFTYTKPSTVPYLNVFCDPMAGLCNDPKTIEYISGFRDVQTSYLLQEYGITVDGPVYSLPAGDLKAAIGIDYTTSRYFTEEIRTYNTPSIALPSSSVTRFEQQVPAAFLQLNIPVFSESNALPLLQRLNFEVSGRYDHYYTFGVTTNPKVAFDWQPYDGVIVTGAWGTSFRAPGVADVSATGSQNRPHNQSAGNNNNDVPMCAPGATTPAPGSLGAVLNPTCNPSLNFPGGIEVSGGSLGAQVLRANGDGIPLNLGPEKATNTSIGLDLLPNFLPGLEVRGTFWNVYVHDFITGTSVNTNPLAATDPIYRHTFIVRGDPQFDADLAAVLALPNNTTQPGLANNIMWIQDGANINAGYLKVSGIDFNTSYTREFLGGSITAALAGTYYLRNETQPIIGGSITDQYNAEGCKCNALLPKLKARAQLGWTDGTYTVNTFVNYTSHYFANQASPPAAFLANFPHYSDVVPAFTTVDLMFGYDTGDTPTQEYLRNLSFNVIVNDVFDKVAPFNYNVGGNSSAFDSTQGETPFGRTITFILTKRF